MAAMNGTIFSQKTTLGDINMGVEHMLKTTVYPSGIRTSDTTPAIMESGTTHSFEIDAPAGYWFLPGESSFYCEVLLKKPGANENALKNVCLAMGAPHSMWSQVTHEFGGTQLLNDTQPYDSAWLKHLQTAKKGLDNTIGDGFWIDAREKRKYLTTLGEAANAGFAQRVALRWLPTTPFFEATNAMWLGGTSHNFSLQVHPNWATRMVDLAEVAALGTDYSVDVFNLTFQAVFVKPLPEAVPRPLRPSHVNAELDYASSIYIDKPKDLTTETATYDLSFPGSATAVFVWLRTADHDASTANKPIHFADASINTGTVAADSSITTISIEHEGVTQPVKPYKLRLDPAARLEGEVAYNDLIDALGSRVEEQGSPITFSNWLGLGDIENAAPTTAKVHGATALGGFSLYGFRLVKPLDPVARTNISLTIERNGTLATKVYTAFIQPDLVHIDFDENLNLKEVTKIKG